MVLACVILNHYIYPVRWSDTLKFFSTNPDNHTPENLYAQESSKPDPLVETITLKIAAWQQSLLDLGKRNRMLNYRETRRGTLRILSPGFTELFQRLCLKEESLAFQGHLAKDNDFDAGGIKTAGSLLERQKTLQNLKAKAKLARDEQGLNVLYLSFGFLEWSEAPGLQAQRQKAPLVLVPVALEQAAIGAPFILSRLEEELVVNPTLQYKYATTYGVKLPDLNPEKPDLNAFMQAMEILADNHGWQLSREADLSLMSCAKIAMYHDLSSNRARIMANPLIRAMSGDTAGIKKPAAPQRDLDFDSVPFNERRQIISADAGQQEALALANAGVSFVLQGPPGTGKSQTIANIIAEALARGRKVLFVAEKAAALKVVHKRLAENGLADFCLPLHNHKCNKREIRDLIAANLYLPHHRVNANVLEELNQLWGLSNELNRYARELHTEIAPLNFSIYSAYGYLAKHAAIPEIEFEVECPDEITTEFFHTMLYSVSDLVESLKRLDGPAAANPWHKTKLTAPDQTMRGRILETTRDLDAKLRHILELSQETDKRFDLATAPSWQGALALLKIMTAVADTQLFPAPWLERKRRHELKKTLRETQNDHAEYLALYQDFLKDFKPEALEFDFEAWLERLQLILQDLKTMEVDLGSNPALEIFAGRKLALPAKELLENLKPIYHDYVHVARSLGLPLGEHFSDMQELCNTIQAMLDAPPLKRAWFEHAFAARCGAILDCAQKRRQDIVELLRKLDLNWDPEIYNLDYKAMLRRFKVDYNGFFKFMHKGYRQDNHAVRGMTKTVHKKLPAETIIQLLQTLRTLDDERRLLKNGMAELETLLGPGACNSETDLDILERSFKTVAKLHALYGGQAPDAIIRVVCAREDYGPTYARLAELSQTLNNDRLLNAKTGVQGLFGAKCAAFGLQDSLFPMLQRLLRHSAALDALHAEIMRLSTREIMPAKFTYLVKSAQKVKQMRRRIAATELNISLQHLYQGPETDWDAAAAELERIDNLVLLLEAERCETVFIRNLCDNTGARQALNDMAQKLCEALNGALPELTVFTGLFYDGAEMENWDLAAVAQRFVRCTQDFEQLDKLLAYHDAQKICVQKGLGEFVMQVDELDGHPDIYIAFQKGFYRQWLSAVLQNNAAVFTFKRNLHEARIQHFSRLDKKQLEIAKYRIRDKITGELPFRNGFVTADDEIRVLKREMDKKQCLLPVRRLLESIPNLLLQLKPCLMMSPLSVSHFLAADAYSFDLVIFDEASQIFPHDAIGAIYRGNQVIIAGDSQQLPPTNFFSTNAAETDDEEPDRVYASILETAADFLPQHRLSWHYRSQHEHLIAFSNREIYRDKLITFPASAENIPHAGVELVYVPNGVYGRGDKSCNYAEAQKCVELLREHLALHPRRSLGIITFSEKQRQAITRAVLKFREENPQHATFFAEDKEEEFFIKTLENAQGDERDTIILSIGYAKDKHGQMHMNFGPLNHLGGERRLNVAVSRAKHNVKLVSSIMAHDIDLERTEALGVRLLRAYLDFAQNGPEALQPLPTFNGNAFTDDFAGAVAAFLVAKGYSVQTNVGCSPYKIDIAIEHPSDSKRFVAAIECDGLTYISGRTVRDREHLRHRVLSGRGWQVYRVWSAEWFADFDLASARLTAFIESTLATARHAAGAENNPLSEPIVSAMADNAAAGEIFADGAETGATTVSGITEDTIFLVGNASLENEPVAAEMEAVLKCLTEGAFDETKNAPAAGQNTVPGPINITGNFEAYETETDAAISALTNRQPGGTPPEDTFANTLDDPVLAVLSKDGDLTELPQTYAKFLADAALTPPIKTKAPLAFTAANTALEDLTVSDTAQTPSPEDRPAQAAPFTVKSLEAKTTGEAFKADHGNEATPTAPEAPDYDNPYGFEYYQEADWARSQLSPQGDKLTHLGEQILYVLQLEQPLHRELLYRRLVGAFNNQKVTAPVRNNVEKALAAKINDRVTIDADGFISIVGFTDVKTRVPRNSLNRRAPEHIAKGEIYAAATVIMQKTSGLKKNALKSELAAVFGYGRRNNKLNHNIDEVLAEMLDAGKLTTGAGNHIMPTDRNTVA